MLAMLPSLLFSFASVLIAVSLVRADTSASLLGKSAPRINSFTRSQGIPSPSEVEKKRLYKILFAGLSQPRTSSREGLTLEGCKSNNDCIEPRTCTDTDTSDPCTQSSDTCLCIPSDLQDCEQSSDCVSGEVCAKVKDSDNGPFCFAEIVVNSVSEIVEATPFTTGGLTWDPCRTTSECEGIRKCEYVPPGGTASEIEECDNDHEEECHCFPVNLTECTSNEVCVEPGEICAEKTNVENKLFLCISEDAEQELDIFTEVSDSTPPPSPLPTQPSPSPFTTGGLTWDPCRTTSECEGIRKCEYVALGGTVFEIEECDNDHEEECHCFPGNLTECTSNEDCVEPGEICAERTNTEDKVVICISEDAEQELDFFTEVSDSTPPPSPLPIPSIIVPPVDDSCIGAGALRHMASNELVYKEHVMANVLCDSNKSCATAAHIVVFNSKPMMMKTYCDIVGCLEKEMPVNSPKYRRGLVVGSATDGLQFTAFAARYGTRVEEAVISSVIRLGF